MDAVKMRQVAFIAEKHVRMPIKAIVIGFHGLGDPGVRTVPNYVEQEWADAGALFVMPYPGPWSWMNRQARAMTDDLIDALYTNFNLSRSVPLILTGGSMGGYCSLLYARYCNHPLKACAAMFPVCDLKYHFSERVDLPRTIHAAMMGYPEDMETLFKEHSPVDQAAKMPKVPYIIVHGDADQAVKKSEHSDRMVKALREHQHDITYVEVPGMGHSDPTSFAVYRQYIDWVKKQYA